MTRNGLAAFATMFFFLFPGLSTGFMEGTTATDRRKAACVAVVAGMASREPAALAAVLSGARNGNRKPAAPFPSYPSVR